MNGREIWFKHFEGLGKRADNLKTLFQNPFTLEDANQWAKEAIELQEAFAITIELAATWIAATTER